MSRTVAILLTMVLGLLTTHDSVAQQSQPGADTVKIVDWKDLVPAGFDPDRILKKYYDDVDSLRDNDPRAQQLGEKLQQVWENAPVVTTLNNKIVKLTGFLVTLEGDGKAVSEFLLVPFFGACIHVPPPPSNQIVLVRMGGKPFKVKEMFQMVAVTGRLRTEAVRNDIASASYVIEATNVEPQKAR
jgi:uncharacterized protein